MSADYSVGTINIPKDKVEEVEKLVKRLELDWLFTVEDQDTDTPFLQQSQTDMGHGTVDDIDEQLMPELAELLNGTAQDGQTFETQYEAYAPTTYIILQGKIIELAKLDPTITGFDTLSIGEERVIQADLKIVGLGRGLAAIISVEPRRG